MEREQTTTVDPENAVDEEQPTLPTYSEEGVDLTLIRWMLSLTPVERLRAMQQAATSAHRLRNARRDV